MAAKTQDVAARLAAAFERAEAERPQAPVLVVWDDPEREFAEQVGDLAPEGVECLLDEEGARFAVKRRLNALAAGERALLYRQRAAHDIADDWPTPSSTRPISKPTSPRPSSSSLAARIRRSCARS